MTLGARLLHETPAQSINRSMLGRDRLAYRESGRSRALNQALNPSATSVSSTEKPTKRVRSSPCHLTVDRARAAGRTGARASLYRRECLLYETCTAALAPLAPGSWPSRNELGGLERARVSSERQPARRAGRERQALAAACRRRGWQLLEPGDEAGLAAQERNAPGLEQALRMLESGEANVLVAAKRERLEQALGELAALLASAQRQGFALIALECAG